MYSGPQRKYRSESKVTVIVSGLLILGVIMLVIGYFSVILPPKQAAQQTATDYATALWLNGNYTAAKSYMSAASLEWELEHEQQQSMKYGDTVGGQPVIKANILSFSGDKAVVEVLISTADDPNFQRPEKERRLVALVKQGDAWKVDIYQSIYAGFEEKYGSKADYWMKRYYPTQ